MEKFARSIACAQDWLAADVHLSRGSHKFLVAVMSLKFAHVRDRGPVLGHD